MLPNVYPPGPIRGPVTLWMLRWKVGRQEFGCSTYATPPTLVPDVQGHGDLIAIQECIN